MVLKYYMPLMVAFAHMLALSGHEKLFGNLYDLNPKNFISFVSTNFINLFALFGILWQCIDYSRSTSNGLARAVIYGIVLFLIIFPLSRQGLKFVLDNVDLYMRKKTKMSFEHNWHLFVFGLIYIIFLLGLQAVLLSLVDTGRRDEEADRLRAQLNKYKQNKRDIQKERNNLEKRMKQQQLNADEKLRLAESKKDEEKINNLVNNIKKNINNIQSNNLKTNKNNKNNRLSEARKMLNQISISNLASFAKKQGIN